MVSMASMASMASMMSMTAASCVPVTDSVPLLESQHTAIFVGLPVALSCALLFLIGLNVALYVYGTGDFSYMSGLMAIVWAVGGVICIIWFCVAFQYGFAPRYLESLYVEANATLVDSTETAFRCVNVHSCACSRSFAESCSTTRVRLLLMDPNTTLTVECGGDSCCRRSRRICASFRQVCDKTSCSTVCDRHRTECIEPVTASKCSASLGICTNVRVTYIITTECNDSIPFDQQTTCQPNEINCLANFRSKYIAPGAIQIYYAPWDTSKRIRHPRSFAGHVVNMTIPLVILFALIVCQAVLMKVFMVKNAKTVNMNMNMNATESIV